MGGERNRVHIVSAKNGKDEPVESWPDMSKADVGARLAVRIAAALGDAA